MPTEDLDVLIVGAGVSGIGMGCALKTQLPGKRFAIVERRQNIGGTWDLFRFPGVRSDSDMYTYGYERRPWRDHKVLAEGAAIRNYLAETARECGVDARVRHGLKIIDAAWSSDEQGWTVQAVAQDGSPRRWRCRQIVMCTGYYNYDAGHTPEFPGIERFGGRVVHPQHWPEDIDYSGRRVVVIGSGATAVTLVPAMAGTARHVTMLQRSPSYYFAVPARDPLTRALARVLPERWALALARRRNLLLSHWLYTASRRWPERMRKFLLTQVEKRLDGKADMRHFTPSYMPWDQRLCIVPDADLFRAIRSGKASVETDHIAGFDADAVLLASGARLEADLLVTATGLDLQALGGTRIHIDGKPYLPQQHMFYKGVLMQDAPNLAWIVGYTNASWTLKADLAAHYLCRLYAHMDVHGLGVATPRDREGCGSEGSIMGSLSSGYIQRANDRLPRQGRKAPWRMAHHYPSDKAVLRDAPIDDGVLEFEPRRAANATAPGQIGPGSPTAILIP